jgi:type VI secretion system protein ImpA
MAFDLEALLEPVSEETPAGEDLSYDSSRYELEQAFESSVSIDASGEETQGEEIDWRRIVKSIEDQFTRSKDIWLAVYLCRAGAKSGSLETVEAGAQALAELMERYWDTVHPTLDELGLPGRKAPCDALSRRAEFLAPLERTPLLVHPRLGSFSGADLERFRSEGASAEGYGMFRAALEDLSAEALTEALTRLERIEDGFRRADKVFTGHAGGEPSPNYGPTYETLTTLKRAVQAFAPSAAGESADSGAGEASYDGGGTAGANGGGGARIGGRVDSREDVMTALDAINDYYRRREPGSPVPVVLERAKAWVNLDFLSVLRDIAPDALDQAKTVLSRREQEGESGESSGGSSW